VSSPAPVALYCLPYAGASASVYVRWKRHLPSWIEVKPVELPGRGRRMGERLETSLPAVLDGIMAEVAPQPGQSFALFGHSLGALLAFELTRRLETQGRAPLVLFASGTRSPGDRDNERFAALSTDAELRAELLRLDGTPASVLAEPELMQLILPVLRADFRVVHGYASDSSRLIRSPLVALGGDSDETTPEQMAAWRQHTRGEFVQHVLPGGHFYIHPQEPRLLGILERELRRFVDQALATPPAR